MLKLCVSCANVLEAFWCRLDIGWGVVGGDNGSSPSMSANSENEEYRQSSHPGEDGRKGWNPFCFAGLDVCWRLGKGGMYRE